MSKITWRIGRRAAPTHRPAKRQDDSTTEDDRRTHWVTATVPTLTVHPVGLSSTLTDMATEAVWELRRPVVIWVAGALNLLRATMRRPTLDWGCNLLHVSLDAFAWSSRTLEKATKRFGR
ncbi:hypothetical protein ANCDUO_11257 [Ancylostoma duodenale]|uniref:Uncharacterized protein n=1 Tax=Ancylostoma duodenale TaxID=51022 RepID=A0A0C2GI43_9BILA|nr:hypothetical protein ANCDUO_11257 [Ancylostoma duodenale]